MALFGKKPGDKGPLDYANRWPLRLWVGAVLLFLYLPLASLVLFSFNDSRRTIRWEGFTVDWYGKMMGDDALISAFANSLTIAAISTLFSVVLGTMTAIALWSFRFPGKGLFDGVVTLPIVVPEICMGVAMLVFFGTIAPWPHDLVWPFDLGAITIAHITFSFPFVAVVVRARLASFNREMEEAARDLGASELGALRDVLLPHVRPALISGALLAFTLSLDDFVITFFTAGPNTVTFPVKIYSMVRFSVTPEVNAASTVLMAITVALTLIGMKLQGRDIAQMEGH
ncbi:binding-protein-dependent transport systems inner membrane component [Novosphingobium nitrogenifigens DSM 19370]|uniref:Binding-protein-dependent transport systems inner membrane component n=1 Tax=Novosphingobium nitrogenifigens DSM 19370 TaxID=983920 RepID=F1Z7U0_9SPHN|nr:ABC transporter permease [Novosphingobium nitrogenifigens]EGD59285.1 binding-protein-dependent transport systems inner membrane component [Novosphingobium nitrogenifigens DSM 19370]